MVEFKRKCPICNRELKTTLDLMHADNISHSEIASMPGQVSAICGRLKTVGFQKPQHIKLPISGNDVMQVLKLKPGKVVGDLFRAIEDAYMENPKMTKNDAIKIVLKKYKEFK